MGLSSSTLTPLTTYVTTCEVEVNDWKSFKRTSSTVLGDSANRYLLSCCEKDLRNSVLREEPRIVSKGKEEVLAAMKKLAVLSIAVCTLQADVIQMRQDHTEPVRQFAVKNHRKSFQWQIPEKRHLL